MARSAYRSLLRLARVLPVHGDGNNRLAAVVRASFRRSDRPGSASASSRARAQAQASPEARAPPHAPFPGAQSPYEEAVAVTEMLVAGFSRRKKDRDEKDDAEMAAVFALASGCGSERYKEILVAEIRRHAMARRLAPREQAIRSG